MKYRVPKHEVIQPLDPSIKLIPLSKGKNAIVDAEDYERLNIHNWYCVETKRQSGSLFYAARFENRKMVYMHREIMQHTSPLFDHINHDTLDNRKANLRPCTHHQNQANRSKNSRNQSPYKGIYWNKQCRKWQAQATSNYKRIYLGLYDSPEEAHEAYCDFAKRRDKDFFHV